MVRSQSLALALVVLVVVVGVGAALLFRSEGGQGPIASKRIVASCSDPAEDLDGFGQMHLLDRLREVDLTEVSVERTGEAFIATFQIVGSFGNDLSALDVAPAQPSESLPPPALPPAEGDNSLGWHISLADGSGPTLSMGLSIDAIDGTPRAAASASALEGDGPEVGLAAIGSLQGHTVTVRVPDASKAFLGKTVEAHSRATRYFFTLDNSDVTRADDYCNPDKPADSETAGSGVDELELGEDLRLHIDGRGMTGHTFGESFPEILAELRDYFGSPPDDESVAPCQLPDGQPMSRVRWGRLHLLAAQGMWMGWIISASNEPSQPRIDGLAGGEITLSMTREQVVEAGVSLASAGEGSPYEVGVTVDGTYVLVDPTLDDHAVLGLAGGAPCVPGFYRFAFDD